MGSGSQGRQGSKGKKQVAVNLDMDPKETDRSHGAIFTNVFGPGEDGMTDDVREKFQLLTKKLMSCEGCPHGTSAYCIKLPNGAHVRITIQHVKSWAKLWVRQYSCDFMFSTHNNYLLGNQCRRR